MRLKNKVAVITGGNSGIGKASAILFLSEGAKVAIVDINDSNKDMILSKTSNYNGDLIFIKADVSKKEDIKEVVKQTCDVYGGIDVLYNNAGTGGKGSTEYKRWIDGLQTNLSGIFYASRAVIPHMKKRKGGSIINTASVAGVEIGFASPQYDAAKAGIIGLTRNLASKYGRFNIRVNSICPGVIDTPFASSITRNPKRMDLFKKDIALDRAGLPEEIAQVALFLASEESSYITGTYIIADGGWTIHGKKYHV